MRTLPNQPVTSSEVVETEETSNDDSIIEISPVSSRSIEYVRSSISDVDGMPEVIVTIAAQTGPWRPMFKRNGGRFFGTNRWRNLCGNRTPKAHEDNYQEVGYKIDISEEEVNSYVSCSVVEKFMLLDNAVVVKCQPIIQKIPSILRDNNNFKKYYEPRVMAIGPYHHENSNLKETENLKLKLAVLFIEEHSLRREVLYSKIKREIKYLRECYEEKATNSFTDEDLTWIFLVDGCALLHYIYCACAVNDKTNENTGNEIKWKFKELKIKVDYLTIVQHDIFLLENQLPYRVLILLISCIKEQRQMKNLIEKFIFESIKVPGEDREWCQIEDPISEDASTEDPIHLLDLFRRRLLQPNKENQASCFIVLQLFKKFFEFMSEPFKNLMECVGKTSEIFQSKQTNQLHFFRNVEELKAAGIRLRPSNTSRLTDVTFSLGTLKLPSIIVDDSTASKFLNMIAYEMCPNLLYDFEVSSFIAFLEALIDETQDVKELRDKRILHNLLGSDEEVAKLFNEIGTNIISNPEIYEDVINGNQKRYDNKFMTWIAQLHHQYFQNPWSMLALFAATVLLVSTIAQTVYTVLGYYK